MQPDLQRFATVGVCKWTAWETGQQSYRELAVARSCEEEKEEKKRMKILLCKWQVIMMDEGC